MDGATDEGDRHGLGAAQARPLSTVAYLHGTSVSFYDAVSNPNIFGPFNENGESFDGPPSNSVFAGAGFIYIAPDYLGLGSSTVPRHRYFHAATEASSAVDLLAASREVLAKLHVRQNGELFTFGFSQGGHSALALHRGLKRRTSTVRHGGRGRRLRRRAVVPGLARQRDAPPPCRCTSRTSCSPTTTSTTCTARPTSSGTYASTVAGLFDMRHFFDDVVAALPPTTPPFSSRRTTAEAARIHRARCGFAFAERRRRGRPQAPVRVYHSPDDEEVPYDSALVRSTASEPGRRRIGAALPGFDHVNSWIQAMPRAASWFRLARASAR